MSVSGAEQPDHRRDSEAELLAALHNRHPLALAEAYHRTIAAGHAVGRRLLGRSGDIEALLHSVYVQLWTDPSVAAGLEGWVRAQCFARGSELLHDAGRAPGAASLAVLLPDLPAPDARYLDPTEKALAELPDTQRRALLAAHDQGVPSADQDGEAVAAVLTRALATLAGPEPGGVADGDGCDDARIADWVLGLLPPADGEAVAAAVGTPACESWAKTLRRGRRRIEGLPPTPDMGNRILVTILTASPGAASPGGSPVPAGSPASAPIAEAGQVGDDDAAARGEEPGTAAGGPAAYAALSDLDKPENATVADPDQSAAVSSDETADASDGSDASTAAPALSDEEASGGSRVLTWLLGGIVVAVGVGLGIVLGLTAFPWLIDRFFS